MAELHEAGKVDIQELTLISGNGVFVSLVSFLIELNLFEDIYAAGLYGNVVVSDSIGLIHKMSLIGEDYLTIKIDTPNFGQPIYKTFRCCGIEHRVFTRDTSTEAYTIHFVSPEVMLDHYFPVQRAFEGNVSDIVEKIFMEYLEHPRNLIVNEGQLQDSEDNTKCSIFTACETPIKFISPSWSPMKCLSWLASKVVSSDTSLQGANFLFFETNKMFYWGSLEDMIATQREAGNIIGVYTYAVANVKEPKSNSIDVAGVTYSGPDLMRDYFSVHELTVLKNVDLLENLQNGYLGSVYHELDVMNKTYQEIKYDHIEKYSAYQHTQAYGSGFFSDDAIRSPYAHQIIGFKHPNLFSGVGNNLNEQASNIRPIRTSLMAELNQIKLKIDVHGRTDVELASMMYLIYPKSGIKDESNKNELLQDPYYSGLYIITAIHHQISLSNHKMTMEIVKDSFGDGSDTDGNSAAQQSTGGTDALPMAAGVKNL